jgi:hypothetical protein
MKSAVLPARQKSDKSFVVKKRIAKEETGTANKSEKREKREDYN